MQLFQHKPQTKLLAVSQDLLATNNSITPVINNARHTLIRWIRTTIVENAVILWNKIKVWRQRSRQRRALSQLNSYQLKDIGVTRVDALHEATKPFWKP